MTAAKLVIIGASGHAKVVIDVVEKQGIRQIALVVDDNTELHGQPFYGYRVMGGRMALLDPAADGNMECLIAIGSNRIRAELAAWVEAHGVRLAEPATHPSAQLGRGVDIAPGSVLMAGCIINADARIGRSVIVNTGATIDHDCRIGDNCHIAPGATLCGNVVVGSGSLVGAGAVIAPGITIGSNVVVGAGATVLANVPDGQTVAGTPARNIHS